MGFNTESVLFLKHLSKQAPLGRCLTLGRQTLCWHLLENKTIKKIAKRDYSDHHYADEFLKNEFGAISVDALDFNFNEGATIIQDLNQDLNPKYANLQYDTVIDFGTLEHIYNTPCALKSILSLCAVNGRIVHALPSNNWCGHGYYQFSPEFFSMIYSEENFFLNTEVLICTWNNPYNIFRLNIPVTRSPDLTGYRTMQLQCLVATQKTEHSRLVPGPQHVYRETPPSISVGHSQSERYMSIFDVKSLLRSIVISNPFLLRAYWKFLAKLRTFKHPGNNKAYTRIYL